MLMRLIIGGRWKSPKHSADRHFDDTHEIKKEILKAVGTNRYCPRVGSNPDIDVEKATDEIVLVGRGPFKGRVYATGIKADDFFVLCFRPLKDQTEIALYMPASDTSAEERDRKAIVSAGVDDVYVVPRDEEVLSALVAHVLHVWSDTRIEGPAYVLILTKEIGGAEQPPERDK